MGSTRTGVQLAYPTSEKYLDKMPEEVIFQRKLNGERVRVEWKDNIPVLWSSCGNEMPYFFKLKEQLIENKLQGVPFDGELYCHGMSREEIHSICSRRVNLHPDENLLSLHAFDLTSENIWFYQEDRIKTLNSLYIKGEFIQKVESILAPKTELILLADQFVKEGYEGIIVRHPYAAYTPRKTRLMLKYKPNSYDIYPIIGYTEEQDIHGFPKGRLGSVLVRDSDGLVFSVGTGNALDAAGRDYWWSRRDSLTSYQAKVKHSDIKTVNGFPTCASLIEIEIIK